MATPRFTQAKDYSDDDHVRPAVLASLISSAGDDNNITLLDKIVVIEDGDPTDALPLPRPPKETAPPIKFLNGLRGLAAIMVVQSHVGYVSELNFGFVGVDVFFVLSAFLLTMLFDRKARQMVTRQATRRQWVTMLLDYFIRRFLRVYPFFMLVAIAISKLSLDNQERYFFIHPPTKYNLFEVLTFKFEQRFHVFWTLPVEIGYYFLIPFLVASMIYFGRAWWVFASMLYIWIIDEGLHKFRVDHMPLRPHLPTLVAGSLGAVVYGKLDCWIKETKFEFKMWHRILVRLIETMAVSLLLSTVFRGLLFHWVFDNPVADMHGARFISVTLTVIIVIEILLPSAISRGLEWNVLCYAGKVSFSIYLLHSFVIWHPFTLAQQWWYDRAIIYYGLTLLVASGSYWAIEHPLQRATTHISRALNLYTRAPGVMSTERSHNN